LNTSGVSSSSWAARHLTYTHGYGTIVAPANAKEPSGEPSFVSRDLPYTTEYEELELEQPAIYFGEEQSGYKVVGSRQRELHYQDEESTQYTEYAGADGVRLDNIFKRAAFALRFADGNPLISDQITPSSRILYMRDVRERVEALAPFLRYDA